MLVLSKFICSFNIISVKIPTFKKINNLNLYKYAKLQEKAMAPHSSTLAWKIPWMEEPGRLHAVHGVAKDGHD